LESLGDRPQAAKAYQRLHELVPHDFYCNLQLGRLLGELGRLSEGEKLLLQAASQRPGVPDVWKELGDVSMAQNKYPQALEAYERAVKFQPREASHLSYLALALAKLNRHAEAIAAYRRAIQMRPEFWEAHFGLAGELAADNQVAEAMREYMEAIRLNPGHAVSRINLGVMLVRQDRLDDALKQFEAALQLEPTNAAAADYLRQISDRRNRKK
jgi:tetratricopeptide (TPR) repeat protein